MITMSIPDCLFCKISKGEIPSSKVYEDKQTFAFLDIAPVHPGHTLVILKNHHEMLSEIPEKDLGHLFKAVQKVAKGVRKGTGCDGINIGMNNGKAAGQLVPHAHIHVIPRYTNDGLRHWPQSRYKPGQEKQIQKNIQQEIK